MQHVGMGLSPGHPDLVLWVPCCDLKSVLVCILEMTGGEAGGGGDSGGAALSSWRPMPGGRRSDPREALVCRWGREVRARGVARALWPHWEHSGVPVLPDGDRKEEQ